MEKVEENLSVLQSKPTNSVRNQRKNEIWTEIADVVNAVGAEKRTTPEVREKWKNLHSQAKKEFAGFKRKTKKTGGGGAPKEPSAATAKIIDLMKETPSFTGLEGFESIGKVSTLKYYEHKIPYAFKAYFLLFIVFQIARGQERKIPGSRAHVFNYCINCHCLRKCSRCWKSESTDFDETCCRSWP